MQYFYGRVHDPLIHCLIHFSGHIDDAALKKAVTLSAQAIPLIRCRFDISTGRPCWIEQDFTGDNMVFVMQSQPDPEDKEQIECLLASAIDIMKEPQLKIYLVKGQDTDTLCAIINHMVCDGAGFKEYLYLLCDLYSKSVQDTGGMPDLGFYSRGTGPLFADFSLVEKLGILFSKYDLSKQKLQTPVCFDSSSGDLLSATRCIAADNPIFVTRRMGKEAFSIIKNHAKNEGVTVNDMVLAAYARILRRKTGTDRVILPCPVDLRKYLREDGKHGICNLTSNFICDVIVRENDSFHDTLLQVSNQMKQQKKSDNCLKSVFMLEFAFHILPFRIMKKIFGKIFTIPVVSYTNLGTINKELLRFGKVGVRDAYLTGAVKYVPYFQIAISTYDDSCTLSCNLHGTLQDKEWVEEFLEELVKEL